MNDLVRNFMAHLRDGFTLGFEGGTCQFVFASGEPGFYLTIEPAAVTASPGTHADPDATVRTSLDVVKLILMMPHKVDVRSDLLSQHLHVTGRREVAWEALNLARRPPEETSAIFKHAREATGTGTAVQPRRVNARSAAAVREAMRSWQPVVVPLATWTSWGVVDLDTLCERLGDCTLPHVGSTTLAAFVAQMRDVDEPADRTLAYTAGCPLPAEMRPHYPPPSLFPESSFLEGQLWMGRSVGDNAVTGLHRDTMTGFLGQLVGEKTFRLYSPAQEPWLYAERAFNYYQLCFADPLAPDPDRFPLFEKAEGIELTLRPGELLITPAGWFHMAEAREPTFSVSHFLKLEAMLEWIRDGGRP